MIIKQRNKKYYLFIALFMMILNVLVGECVSAQKNNGTLVVFSGRKEPLIRPVIELFEKTSGIKVILKTGKSSALGQQILQELPNPSADIYIAKESGSLEYLRLKDAFAPYVSANTRKIAKKFKARDGSWIGISGRSRAVIYNTTQINEDEVPSTLDSLSDSKWAGKIAAVNSGNESFVAWVSALRIKLGDDKARSTLEKLKQNKINLLSQSHTDVRKAIGRGEYPLGLINHYYFHLQKREVDADLRNVGIVYLDQGQGERGELVNVSGVAIVRGAKHLTEAQAFIDFLISPAAQKLFAEVNFEYPLLVGVKAHKEVFESLNCEADTVLECLNVMDVHLDQLGPLMDDTFQMLEDVQWY